MRFDYYASTIRDTPDRVISSLADRLGASVTMGHGLNSYENSNELRVGREVVGRVLHGGVNPFPHAFASGQHTDAFVPVVRELWPDRHQVSRADVAEDFDQADAWDLLLRECLAMAEDRSLAIDQQGDWIRGEAGRTFYAGGRKSASRVRLYEKGKQLRGLVSTPQEAEEISAGWVRLELQVRPQKEGKRAAASACPQELWGYSKWTKELAVRCLEIDVDRFQMNPWREGSTDVKAWGFMLRQWGPLMRRMEERAGSWEAFSETLRRGLHG